jgi:ABC-type multidrug transport system ATPase subunit
VGSADLCDTVAFLVDGYLAVQENPARLKQRYGNPGIVVYGRDHDGVDIVREYPYRHLITSPLNEFSHISDVSNRDVSLETVFLTVTGRSLHAPGSGPGDGLAGESEGESEEGA